MWFIVWFFVAGVAAVLVHNFIFELRYIWNVSVAEANFIRDVYRGLVLVIVGLWIFFPSRILVAMVGLLALIFPPLYKSNVFVPIDLPYACFMLFSIGLLIAATELRRRVAWRSG